MKFSGVRDPKKNKKNLEILKFQRGSREVIVGKKVLVFKVLKGKKMRKIEGLKKGSMVCLNNYDGKNGIRFGFVETVFIDGFLVEMQMDQNKDPIHYENGFYRHYKFNKIQPNDIVVV